MMDKIVIDSCVLVKLFIDESDSDQAVQLMKHIINEDIEIVVPELLIIETIGVCLSQGVDADKLCRFFETHKQSVIRTPNMSNETMRQAGEIVNSGNPKSGFPSYNDSVYHAYSMAFGTVFITADERHNKKTKEVGRFVLLKDWQELFIV